MRPNTQWTGGYLSLNVICEHWHVGESTLELQFNSVRHQSLTAGAAGGKGNVTRPYLLVERAV